MGEYRPPIQLRSPVQRPPELTPIQRPISSIEPPSTIQIDYDKLIEAMVADGRFVGPAGPAGADGAPGADGLPGPSGSNADCADLWVAVDQISERIDEIEADPGQPVIAEGWSHIVLVASSDAEYWPRLEDDFERAQDYYYKMRHVEPPSYPVRGEMPTMVAYGGGDPQEQWSGLRDVEEALSAISRGELDDYLESGDTLPGVN